MDPNLDLSQHGDPNGNQQTQMELNVPKWNSLDSSGHLTGSKCNVVDPNRQCSDRDLSQRIGALSDCMFPDYLQSELDEFGEPLPWNTKMWWLSLRNSPKLKEKQEIFVQSGQIWSQRQVNRIPCDQSTRRISNRATSSIEKCSEKFLLYNRTCLLEEQHNKFRVIQYGASRLKKIFQYEKSKENYVTRSVERTFGCISIGGNKRKQY